MLTNQAVGVRMYVIQPEVAGIVISFALYANRALARANESCFTPRDHFDFTNVEERARLAGFDRLVMHDRDDGDASDVGDFATAYQRGQSWSRWGFARAGAVVRAWCCLTGEDVGEFRTLGDAFNAVLFKDVNADVSEQAASNLIPFRMMCDARMGSAA